MEQALGVGVKELGSLVAQASYPCLLTFHRAQRLLPLVLQSLRQLLLRPIDELGVELDDRVSLGNFVFYVVRAQVWQVAAVAPQIPVLVAALKAHVAKVSEAGARVA